MDYDLGNLMACDPNPQDAAALSSDREAHCLETATRITQSLVSQLFKLPGQLAGMGRVVTLPAPTFQLPRHKPLPAPRLPTRCFCFSLGLLHCSGTSFSVEDRASFCPPSADASGCSYTKAARDFYTQRKNASSQADL